MFSLIRRAALAAGIAIMAAVPLIGVISGAPPAQAATCSATSSGGVAYQGGSVQHDPTFYAVYWLPSGDNFEPGVAGGNAQYENRIDTFLGDVKQTNLANVVSQYYDCSGPGGTEASVGTGSTFGGSWVDTSAYPNGEGTNTNVLQDQDIQNEVANAFTANSNWQPGVSTTVFVFTAWGAAMCFNDPGTNGCTPGVNDPSVVNNPVATCGAHYIMGGIPSKTNPGTTTGVAYAALPLDEPLAGCSGTGALPQGDIYADTEISPLSHELFEAETDPYGTGGWDNPGGGPTGSEIADKCDGDFGNQPYFGPSGYDVSGRLYAMQQVWSDLSNSCEGSTIHGGFFQVYGPFSATAGQSTSNLLLAITNNPPNLVAAPSPTMDWGDGNTSQVTIGSCAIFNCNLQASHTYASPGDYEGTLTYWDGFAISITVHIWFRVFPAPLNPQSITFTSTPPSQAVYGGSYTPAATGGGSGNPVTFSIDPSSSAGACAIDNSGKVTFTGTGTCVIDANQAAGGGYAAGTQQQQTVNIGPATLTVRPSNESKTYGAADPAFGYQITGFVNGDQPSVVTSQPSCGVAAAHTNAGTYAISCSGGAAPNYTFDDSATATLTVNPATLTVTADNQSRLFGAANSPLTYKVSGFVNGDGPGVVSGSAACTTTALASSPGGSYPISCTQGNLHAVNYNFAFGAGTLTVGYTGGSCLTGSHSGTLTVAAGQAVCLGSGFSQNGKIIVQAGAALDIRPGAILSGALSATGATALRVCGAQVTGPVTLSASSGLVVVGDDEGPACAGNAITGPVVLTSNSGGVEFDYNTVNGPLTITGTTGTVPPPDTGSLVDVGNTVTGSVHIG
jgi:hypothetical protein